jgi:purine-binding chemotaxis protein CheW
LAERLGLPTREQDPSSVVVVVEAGDRIVGLVVDGVCDIITVTEDMIQGTPEVGSASASQIVQGLLTLDGRIVSIISIPAILPESLPEMMAA